MGVVWMRMFVYTFCMCAVFMPVYADDSLDVIESTDTENLVFMLDDTLLTELKPIKEKLATIDSDFVSSVESVSPAQQVRMIRGYLAQKSFEYYDTKYTQMLKDASESTGRIIKTESHDMGNGMRQEYAWLDKGELDNENMCYNLLERRACDYPDGFEEFSIVKNIGGNIQSINISTDDIDSNTHYEISISLSNNYENNNSEQFLGSITLHVFIDEYEYDEWYAWRNQEMADIRAGKYIPVSENEQPDSNSPFGKLVIKMDESRKWESNNIPKSRVHGRVRSFFDSSVQNVTGVGNEQ